MLSGNSRRASEETAENDKRIYQISKLAYENKTCHKHKQNKARSYNQREEPAYNSGKTLE